MITFVFELYVKKDSIHTDREESSGHYGNLGRKRKRRTVMGGCEVVDMRDYCS